MACGYVETVQVTSQIPTFMTFNEATNDFTIFTDDVSHAESYSIVTSASIEVPIDFTRS